VNGAAFRRNREDIVAPATPHNQEFVREENFMDNSQLDMSNTPIRPNQQPLERQAALPNCDTAPCTEEIPRRIRI
jgi:hypothetical protein